VLITNIRSIGCQLSTGINYYYFANLYDDGIITACGKQNAQ